MTSQARVVALAVRSGRRGPMIEVDEAVAECDSGLAGDLPARPPRGLTLLAQEQWLQVCAELNAELPWHTRRANVLVEGLRLGELIGARLALGEVEIDVVDETEPCGEMDRLHPGLRRALTPDCRGGVHGRIVRAGTIRTGDPVRVLSPGREKP